MGAPRRYPNDLTPFVFGRLTPIRMEGRDRAGQRWLCKCECGKDRVVQRSALVAETVFSCGCYLKEVARKKGLANRTHGQSHTPTHNIWVGMHKRCNDLTDSRYGGRGIKVCERWRSYENFLADMGERPESMSIERENVNGDYEPENCRWATDEEQANNRRNTRFVEFSGKRQSISQWAAEIGVKAGTLRFRLEKGWSIERALTTETIK